MAQNKSKIDNFHDLLPKHLNTRGNENWKALIEALGEQDQKTADLLAEVRKQFFIKTASRPYLDRLAANHKIARPRLVGMDDPSFREYIPVLSYQPKQVKSIIDKLLDVFFFKESTTAFVTTETYEPFNLSNNWELQYLVDENFLETIFFKTDDFTNIASATADEIVAAINRQAKRSYATKYYDSITKQTYIKLFTNTIGSKGSLRILGGRSNIAFKFNGFINSAGVGSNTQWTVSKVGEDVKFKHTGGMAPGIDEIQVGDIAIIDLVGNTGSFKITKVDLVDNSFSFKNVFATVGVFTQTNSNQVKFIRPNKYVAYLNNKRAITWETSPGEIIVEMPTSPPVVKRSLKGSTHINGAVSLIASRDSNTSLTLVDASQFPNSGSFYIEETERIKRRILTDNENIILDGDYNNRLISKLQKYTYTSRTVLTTTGNIVSGQNQITNLASTIGIAVGQEVDMVGVPKYAKVIGISGTTVTINFSATQTATGATVNFLGNQLTGISPNLPQAALLNEFSLSSLSRLSNIVTGTTVSPHSYSVGDTVIISGSSGINTVTTTGDWVISTNQITNLASMSGISTDMLVFGPGIPSNTKVIGVSGTTVTLSKNVTSTVTGGTINFNEDLNGSFIIQSITPTTFTFNLSGSNGSSLTPGSSRIEKPGFLPSSSRVILNKAISNEVSRITGSYIWDSKAPFVLSSKHAISQQSINKGTTVKILSVNSTNDLPQQGGLLIFNYGLNNQEGPIRYLYKATNNTIILDPSYTFKNSHSSGSRLSLISKIGPHQMSLKANEYGAYITDPSEARIILQDLIRSVKSAGIFINFLIRYPEQLYATIDVYQSGIDPG